MVAHMDRAAWEETLATGRAVYFSRSRGRLWRKGEESGNIQHVRDDPRRLRRRRRAADGRSGRRRRLPRRLSSCFFREVTPDGLKVVAERVFDPATVYGKQAG